MVVIILKMAIPGYIFTITLNGLLFAQSGALGVTVYVTVCVVLTWLNKVPKMKFCGVFAEAPPVTVAEVVGVDQV
jgi:hypothetical protein